MVNINQRMHSAEHVFVQSLIRQNKSIVVEKVELGDIASKVFVFADKLNWYTIFKAEELANNIIKEGKDITIKEISKDEAAKLGDIRIRLDRINGDKVRVVEVKDFDVSACAGEHCSNTSQIGGFLVTGFNALGNKYEIRFKVDIIDDLFEDSRKIRELLTLLNCPKEKAFEIVRNLQEKNKSLTEQLREIQKEMPLKVDTERAGSVNLVYGNFDNYERLILMRKINDYLNEKTVVCFLNTADKGTYIIISVSEDSGKNANELLQGILKEFNGKGGGKEKFASGFVDIGYKEKVIPKLKEILT